MEKTYISIGSDYTVMTTVTDSNSNSVDLSGMSRIDLFLQYENEPKILKSFSTNDGTLIVEDAENGLLKLYLQRADTLIMKHNKNVFLSIKAWETDDNFADDIAKYESFPNYYFTPYKSAGYGS